MHGGAGDDTLLSERGDDRFLGGTGNDLVDYSQAYFTSKSDGLKVNLATGRAKGEGADRLAGVEGVRGSGYGNDVLTANDAGSMLDGGFGADILIGGAAADILRAGATDSDPDTLEGKGGNDTLDFGGSGDDKLTYEHAPSEVHVDLVLSTVSGGDGADVLMGSPAHRSGRWATARGAGDSSVPEADRHGRRWARNPASASGRGRVALDAGHGLHFPA